MKRLVWSVITTPLQATGLHSLLLFTYLSKHHVQSERFCGGRGRQSPVHAEHNFSMMTKSNLALMSLDYALLVLFVSAPARHLESGDGPRDDVVFLLKEWIVVGCCFSD